MADAKMVTFYLIRLDGELAIRETPIYFPKAAVFKGRTKAEDDRDTSYDVIFMDGRLTVPADSAQAKWLSMYNSGGTLDLPEISDKPIVIKPNTQLFTVTTKDPSEKNVVTQEVVKEIQVAVVAKEFLDMLTVDQIEAYCTANGISLATLDQTKRTKAGLTKFLDENGHVKK